MAGVTMQKLTTFKFRRIVRSSALEDHAHALSSELRQIDERITQCQFTLEKLADTGSVAESYSLNPDGSGHAALYPALRASYENARRQLQNLHHQWPSRLAGR